MNTSLHVRPAPPLIQADRVPLWLVFRDLLLTVIAWMAIIQSMRYAVHLLYDYLRPPIFELTYARIPHVLEIWAPLKAFVLVAACLVIWLAFWAVRGTRRLRATHVASQPDPLRISEHASYLGVEPNDFIRWKSYRIAIVTFNSDNQIAKVLRHDLSLVTAATPLGNTRAEATSQSGAAGGSACEAPDV